MNTIAAPPIAIVQQPDDTALAFRLNQRIAAEVLHVASDQVVLALDGVRVVARLISPDQAAILARQRLAQFVVRGFSGQTIELQLVPSNPDTPTPTPLELQDLIPNLLERVGLPLDEVNIRIAQALLKHNLPVTKEIIIKLQQTLSELPSWDASQADLAAALVDAGLPLSPGVVELLAQDLSGVRDLISRLRHQFQSLIRSDAKFKGLLRQSLTLLNQMEIDWTVSRPIMAGQIRRAITILGRSIEQQLSEQSASSILSTGKPPPGLLAIASLRRELSQAGHHGLASEIDRFLDALRVMQFINAPPDQGNAEGRWLTVTLPLTTDPTLNQPQHQPTLDPTAAQLRIAYRGDGRGASIDAKHTRLVLEVELGQGESLKVDLSVVERQIGAQVTASNSQLLECAQAELSGLEIGLEQLGFALQTARCTMDTSEPPTTLHHSMAWSNFSEINVEA